MAITAVDYLIISQAFEQSVFPKNPDVVELGEANWYCDVPLQQLADDIHSRVEDKSKRNQLLSKLQRLDQEKSPLRLFEIAKVFYEVFLNPASLTAIDLHGSPSALRYDLNNPVSLEKRFNVLLNLGTGEHVFNVYQFFKTGHDLTVPGGIMIHGSMPFTGWYDHGFYSFHPTFYWDMAISNEYEVIALVYAELSPPKLVQIDTPDQVVDMAEKKQIARHSLLYAILRKAHVERDFSHPMQGYYADSISAARKAAWNKR